VLLTEIFGFTLSALTVWGFLMALLINVLVHFTTNSNTKTNIFVSLVMFVSYFVADDAASLSESSTIYLNWGLYDLATVILIATGLKLIKLESSVAPVYVVCGLILNSLLYFSMYYDVVLQKNFTPWILWDLYTMGGTIVDLSMVAVLILNRDFLKLKSATDKLFKKSTVELPSLK